ncbi:gamma carbonic anhydrase family protein [Eubacterium multiforme]|uniref:Carbonic anhydrase/acetyltransferase-like protein (Isoleucine patch superfamily) n=1 Tax=Eubacterium multiforme TaxID=83339 RepID=A0ABT9URP7_9FIRM|nr:gamma carbonic anhydrase family protein [Eubacterium multiforme]MDQ0148379.1 carbonic anhydrase/acetyltransferase-like protein (isoleucine patch superfamily) [Eubacterium multiforme]
MIKDFRGRKPQISESAYISESVDIIGDVVVEENCSIWFGSRLRGDVNRIYIGRGTNIQENSIVHVEDNFEVNLGENVTVGHGAIVHGCIIGENTLIGMGSIILNGVRIGKNSIVGAGSLVPQNKEFGEGLLILGNPARVVRRLTEEEIEGIRNSAKHYIELSREYA